VERLKSLCSLPVWVDITWTQLQIRGPEFAPRLRVELALGFDSQSALNGAFRETVVVFLVLLGFFVHLRAAFGVSITVAPVSYDGYCSEVAEIPKKKRARWSSEPPLGPSSCLLPGNIFLAVEGGERNRNPQVVASPPRNIFLEEKRGERVCFEPPSSCLTSRNIFLEEKRGERVCVKPEGMR